MFDFFCHKYRLLHCMSNTVLNYEFIVDHHSYAHNLSSCAMWLAPDGLIAQVVEHCTSIAEVMGSNPIQAGIFFSGFIFTTAQIVCITAMINLL